MFTGLVEDTGRVVSLRRNGDAAVLEVETSLPVAEISLGDSIAVNGACLTVTSIKNRILSFDVSPESLTRTTISSTASSSRVNLERALKMGARLGGHIVSGHIDCTATLTGSKNTSGNHQLEFTLNSDYSRYLIDKGSITIDGISLTINNVSALNFTVNIIPHTFINTNLNQLHIGDRVNIETDIIGKYVEKLTMPWRKESGLTMKTLAENGFI